MKMYLLIFCTVFLPAAAQTLDKLPELFSFSSTTTWKDFTHELSQKRWVWTGMITLKSTEPVNLQEICLHWQGEKIGKLQASLYQKKETEHNLIPIQENLICDGRWNSKNQRLTFFLDKKIVAINKYYLFLHFPKADVPKIKNGSFVIPGKESLKITCLN